MQKSKRTLANSSKLSPHVYDDFSFPPLLFRQGTRHWTRVVTVASQIPWWGSPALKTPQGKLLRPQIRNSCRSNSYWCGAAGRCRAGKADWLWSNPCPVSKSLVPFLPPCLLLCIYEFKPHNHLRTKKKNGGTETLSNFPKVTELISRRVTVNIYI